MEGRTGYYWTKSDNRNDARAVAANGSICWDNVNERDGGARPALPFSSIDSIPTNGVSGKRAGDGVLEVEYGYYPQKAVSRDMQQKLERAFERRSLSRTGKKYTTDSRKYNKYAEVFSPKQHEEFKLDGKKYVRVEANSCFNGGEFKLSNGEIYRDGDPVWVEVAPVKWLVDEKAKMMLTDKLIFSGVQFKHPRDYHTEDFDKADIKTFMDKFLSKELEQSRGTIDLIELKLTNGMFPEKVVGSTNFQTGQEIPPSYVKNIIMEAATEEEKEAVKENIERIYEVADRVYEASMKNDKKIVILLDELLNVKPQVQSLVYTLVLNRFIESGKGIKLPENVVIAATGNQKKYSVVAEDLAEPLEKRFDHILDMEPKVGEWITEYALPHKVHPAVIGYMLSKYNMTGKSEDISEIGYFYEEPEVGEEHLDSNGCKGRTNDPRGWTSISNTLYNFENNLQAGKYEGKNVEDILHRSLSSKLREEWAEEFFDFYNLPTLTPEEVVRGMKTEENQKDYGYTQADLPGDISERFGFMTALITADEKQVEACREFIRKHCDPEYVRVYDIYWAGNDKKKQEKIGELEEMDDINLSLHTGMEAKISEIQEMSMLHTSKEAKDYAEDGVNAYSKIGKMYDSYLNKNKEEHDDR